MLQKSLRFIFGIMSYIKREKLSISFQAETTLQKEEKISFHFIHKIVLLFGGSKLTKIIKKPLTISHIYYFLNEFIPSSYPKF